MDLGPAQLSAWIRRLALNIHDPALLLSLEHMLTEQGVSGRQFDSILDQNLLPELLLRHEAVTVSPSVANLVRKLWHVDFFPAVSSSDRRVHSCKLSETPRKQISVSEAAEIVDRVMEVTTPDAETRERLLGRVEALLPAEVKSEISCRHRKV